MSGFFKFLFLCFISSIALCELGDSGGAFLIEVRGGQFVPSANDFEKIYSDKSLTPTLGIGIGLQNSFLVARYQEFKTTGESIIDGADIKGKANWEEIFYSIGLRTYEAKPMYFELAYIVASIKESISTDPPDYPALNRKFSSEKNEGVALAIGVNFKIVGGLYLAGELHYKFIELKIDNKEKEPKQIGGPGINIGLTLVVQ